VTPGREFTVTKVEPGVARVGGDLLSQQAQGQYVLVHVTVANVGNEAQIFSDSSSGVDVALVRSSRGVG
jgi:hypothetical protein